MKFNSYSKNEIEEARSFLIRYLILEEFRSDIFSADNAQYSIGVINRMLGMLNDLEFLTARVAEYLMAKVEE